MLFMRKEPDEFQQKESGTLPLFFCAPELVVLRVHGGPAADLVADEPQVRWDAVYVSDLPGVSGVAPGKGALRPQD
jgi:hypothetical protein